LVVVVVIDQLASWAFERYLPHLSERGGFKRAIARGSYFPRVAYDFALTNTAPGHAAIFTGASPFQSGVTSNSVFDADSGERRPFIADGEHAVFGVAGHTAAPLGVRVPTVGDELSRVTGGKGLVLSISAKDRAAIVSGGVRPNLAVWFEHKAQGFTTSRYYAEALPPWLSRYQAQHPTEALLTPWLPGDPALLARIAGADDAPGEGDHLHLGVTFPHDPNAAGAERFSALRLFPQLTEYTLALARVAADELGAGRDDTVDLMALSLSGLDYTGHTFGPSSWEYADHLMRIDVALGQFLDALEASRGPLGVVITSDHGITPIPAQNPKGGRLLPAAITERARQAVASLDLDPKLVEAFVFPFVYLDASIVDRPERARMVAAISAALNGMDGIHLAADVREAYGWRDDPDRVRRAVGRSVAEDTPGEIFIVPREGWVVDEGRPPGAGTTHGTPWDDDRLVPVIVYGPGVDHAQDDSEIEMARVAPTIARLLGIAPPSHVRAEPLPGVHSVSRD
jgi:hypothetical protein